MILLFLLLFPTPVTDNDIELNSGKNVWHTLEPAPTMSEAVVRAGLALLDRPYEPHTLERKGDEALVVRFQSFDCFTFMETSIAMARCMQQPNPDFETFSAHLQLIRYRSGNINGYPSRLHYTTDWAYDNERKGLIRDITRQLGGERSRKKIDFMSTHPHAYRKLNSDPEAVARIREVEQAMNQRAYYYLAKERVSAIDDRLEHGDLIAITTSIKGLDILHVGIAVRQERIHLLHASQKLGKVVLSQEPLHDLLSDWKNASGIMVFRTQSPKKELSHE